MSEPVKGISELRVSSYTDVIGPGTAMLGPIADGSTLVVDTAQGCWGPMITPQLRGGHEVTQPVAVEGAEVGDVVVLEIKRITVRSGAAASGTHAVVPGRNQGDAAVMAVCPGCGKVNPPTYLKGIGAQAVRCQACDAEAIPFISPHGFTMVFDNEKSVGLTLNRSAADQVASRHAEYSGIKPGARQHSALVLALADLPGALSRVRPMIGNIGTMPAVRIPASCNAGDAGRQLVGATHDLGLTEDEFLLRTDAHMDIDTVGEGSVVICPVKVPGAGIYVGDAHAMQGDGEISGHTTDVAAEVVIKVSLVKNLPMINGPLLLPKVDDLPPLARPFSAEELAKAAELARAYGVDAQTDVAPVQVVGTGSDLDTAIQCGIERLAKIADMSEGETRNRITISGGVEIGRVPGVVQVTAQLPLSRLDQLGLGDIYRRQYGL